jgi:hypothetical protein
MNPLAQEQSSTLVEAGDEVECSGQCLQAVDTCCPGCSLYVLAGQMVGKALPSGDQ